jgi:hypothetical protein
MWHAWERRENCTEFWWEGLKERGHPENRGVDGRMRSEWRFAGGWNGFSWLGIVTDSGLL